MQSELSKKLEDAQDELETLAVWYSVRNGERFSSRCLAMVFQNGLALSRKASIASQVQLSQQTSVELESYETQVSRFWMWQRVCVLWEKAWN
jgi:hypothetical protein